METLKKVLNWKDFVWPTGQGIKAANFFGLRLIFFEKKKKKNKTRTQIYLYTKKTTFREEGIAVYCIQILGDLKEFGNIAPILQK